MRASLNQNQRANKQRNVFNKLALYYWAMASKWPNILCDVKQNNFNSLLLYFMQSLEQMLFIRTSVVKRERKSEWERVSLIFNILVFRSQLFSMVQNMYDTHTKSNWKRQMMIVTSAKSLKIQAFLWNPLLVFTFCEYGIGMCDKITCSHSLMSRFVSITNTLSMQLSSCVDSHFKIVIKCNFNYI